MNRDGHRYDGCGTACSSGFEPYHSVSYVGDASTKRRSALIRVYLCPSVVQLNRSRNMDNQMTDHSARKRLLPCRADRTKIIEQAKLVQAQAQALAKQLDQSLTLLAAEQPMESQDAVTSPFVATRAARVFIADQS